MQREYRPTTTNVVGFVGATHSVLPADEYRSKQLKKKNELGDLYAYSGCEDSGRSSQSPQRAPSLLSPDCEPLRPPNIPSSENSTMGKSTLTSPNENSATATPKSKTKRLNPVSAVKRNQSEELLGSEGSFWSQGSHPRLSKSAPTSLFSASTPKLSKLQPPPVTHKVFTAEDLMKEGWRRRPPFILDEVTTMTMLWNLPVTPRGRSVQQPAEGKFDAA